MRTRSGLDRTVANSDATSSTISASSTSLSTILKVWRLVQPASRTRSLKGSVRNRVSLANLIAPLRELSEFLGPPTKRAARAATPAEFETSLAAPPGAPLKQHPIIYWCYKRNPCSKESVYFSNQAPACWRDRHRIKVWPSQFFAGCPVPLAEAPSFHSSHLRSSSDCTPDSACKDLTNVPHGVLNVLHVSSTGASLFHLLATRHIIRRHTRHLCPEHFLLIWKTYVHSHAQTFDSSLPFPRLRVDATASGHVDLLSLLLEWMTSSGLPIPMSQSGH